MKSQVKYFLSGVILTLIVMYSFPTFADSLTKTVEVAFNSINIQVNGQAVAADNILYKDTTYVPLRNISEMLNKDVIWDRETNTAKINNKSTRTDKIDFGSDGTYIGEIKDNLPNGYGLFITPDGSINAGNFSGSLSSMKGIVLLYNDGLKYIGEWSDNKFAGDGIASFKDGQKAYTKDGEISQYIGTTNTQPSTNISTPSTDTIVSHIDGTFEGFGYENIYKLDNGQIWQQSSFEISVTYKYHPGVIIYKSDTVYKMKVDGSDKTIIVKQIK